MGKVGQWRQELSERPEYQEGQAAFRRGDLRPPVGLGGEGRQAWQIGYDDARDDAHGGAP